MGDWWGESWRYWTTRAGARRRRRMPRPVRRDGSLSVDRPAGPLAAHLRSTGPASSTRRPPRCGRGRRVPRALGHRAAPGYLLLVAVFPVLWVAVVAANRGYEPRFLVVGSEEFRRVGRAALALTASSPSSPTCSTTSCRGASCWSRSPLWRCSRWRDGTGCASGFTAGERPATICTASSWSVTRVRWSTCSTGWASSATTGCTSWAPACRCRGSMGRCSTPAYRSSAATTRWRRRSG